MTFSYPKYLKSKRSIDERARHPGVWNTFLDQLRDAAAGASATRRDIRILEVGGGVGDLAMKILYALPEGSAEYTLVDIDPDNLKAARERFQQAFPEAALSPVLDGIGKIRGESSRHSPTCSSRRLSIYLVRDDITNVDASAAAGSLDIQTLGLYDAICGQAIMDIVPARILLQNLSLMLSPRGVIYLPIHFDGRTDIDPSYDSQVDQMVTDIYHDSMARTWIDADGNVHPYDGSRSGRDLIMHAASANLSVVEAGASNWIVLPSARRDEGRADVPDGRVPDGQVANGRSADATFSQAIAPGTNHYPAREAYFLQCMLHFIEGELAASEHISDEDAKAWVTARRQQLATGQLAMFVHNLDVLLAPES